MGEVGADEVGLFSWGGVASYHARVRFNLGVVVVAPLGLFIIKLAVGIILASGWKWLTK